MYATSKYSDDKIQFASRFFLQTHPKVNQNDDSDSNYSTILTLYLCMGFMQIVIIPLFGLLYVWSITIAKNVLVKLTDQHEDYTALLTIFNYHEFYSKLVIFMFIVGVYIAAMVELSRYSEETFNSSAVAIIHIIFFILTILVTLLSFIFGSTKCCLNCKNKQSSVYFCVIDRLNYFTTIAIFLCLGYFFPYIIIALIQDPLNSGFTYVVIIVIVVLISIPQLTWLIKKLPIAKGYSRRIVLLLTLPLVMTSVLYFLLMLITVFTLGSFADFDDLKNIVLPLFTSLIVSVIGVSVVCLKKQVN